MYLAIFLTIFFILINGFLIGKIFKKYKPTLNVFQFLLFGTVAYLGLINGLLIPLFLFNITLKFIFIYYLIFQCVLALIYVFNWRWLFITYVIDWRKLIFFFVVFVILITGWVLTRSLSTNSDWTLNLSNNLIYQLSITKNNNISNIIAISGSTSAISLSEGLIINYLRGFIYITNLYDVNEIKIYISVFFLFLLIYLLSLTITSFYFRLNSYWFNYLLLGLMILLLGVVVFAFQTYSIIIVFGLILVGLHFNTQKIKNDNMLIIFINFLVLAGFGLNANFVLVAIIVNLIVITISYQNKMKMATDFNILMMLSTLLSFTLLFKSKYYIGLILLVALILFYLFYFLFKTSSLYVRTITRIDGFIYRNINFIVIVISLIILLTAMIMFFSANNISYESWLINNKIFTNNAISANTSSIKFIVVYSIVNILFWITNVSIFIYALFKNSFIIKKNQLDNESYYANFILLAISIFWNPFFTTILSKIIDLSLLNIFLDIRTFFWVICFPIFFKQNNRFFANNKITTNKSISICIIISVLSTLITLKNLV